jgi:thiamine biosynthesis lipoprotein
MATHPAPAAPRPSRRKLWAAALAAALPLLLIVAVAVSSSRATRFQVFQGEAMATLWQVELPARPDAPAAAEACFELYRRLDLELSEWKPGSPLSAVNRAAGERPVEVPEELLRLVGRALDIGRETDGAFDVSWAALWGLWDFRAAAPRVPAAAEIEARRTLVDGRRVVLDPAARTLFLPAAGMKLGLGGIAKGYALDRAAALLEARGFHDFLLTGGGQVVARGRRGDRPWRIGVRDPRGERDEIFARVEPGDASLSTSADNESFFEVAGVRYHHILDPRTGWPARGLRSATVLHPDATLADALSTAVLVLGRERGLEVARRLGAEALVVDERGEVATTPGFGARLELLRPPRAD